MTIQFFNVILSTYSEETFRMAIQTEGRGTLENLTQCGYRRGKGNRNSQVKGQGTFNKNIKSIGLIFYGFYFKYSMGYSYIGVTHFYFQGVGYGQIFSRIT